MVTPGQGVRIKAGRRHGGVDREGGGDGAAASGPVGKAEARGRCYSERSLGALVEPVCPPWTPRAPPRPSPPLTV